MVLVFSWSICTQSWPNLKTRVPQHCCLYIQYDSICAIICLGLCTLGECCGYLHNTDGLHLPQRKDFCLNWLGLFLNSQSTFFWPWSILWLNLLRSWHGLDYNTTLWPKVYCEEETTAMFPQDAGTWTQGFVPIHSIYKTEPKSSSNSKGRSSGNSILKYQIQQGCQVLLLKCHWSTEFSFNLPQHTCLEVSSNPELGGSCVSGAG